MFRKYSGWQRQVLIKHQISYNVNNFSISRLLRQIIGKWGQAIGQEERHDNDEHDFTSLYNLTKTVSVSISIILENKYFYSRCYFHSHYHWLDAAVSVWDHADLSDHAELIQLVSLLISLLFQDWNLIQCILIVLVRLYWTLIKMQWKLYELATCDKVFRGLLKEERKQK